MSNIGEDLQSGNVREDLLSMREVLSRFNAERDWGKFHGPRNLAMALSVECGELLSHYLWCFDGADGNFSAEKKASISHEAADVLICLLNFCEAAGIDIGSAFYEKIKINAAHYPVEKCRGSAKKYTEIGE